jgi:hypothetical protein
MRDSVRRSSLLQRSKALRSRATAFTDRLRDAAAKDFMRRTVLNSLDDVDRFFLEDPNGRPSDDMWETMWLDSAETILSSAEQSFSKFESQVRTYGGPENVKVG